MSRERPVLFGGGLVRAILAGRKTETRRPAKTAEMPDLAKCPIAMVGDVLWVRETWALVWGGAEPCECEGKAPGNYCLEHDTIERRADTERDAPADWDHVDPEDRLCKWQPSMHMRRAACRITMPVVSLGVERVQAIDDAGALAEGILPTAGGFTYVDELGSKRTKVPAPFATPRAAFESLWRSIYRADAEKEVDRLKAWDANPWVWVIGWGPISRTDQPKE